LSDHYQNAGIECPMPKYAGIECPIPK